MWQKLGGKSRGICLMAECATSSLVDRLKCLHSLEKVIVIYQMLFILSHFISQNLTVIQILTVCLSLFTRLCVCLFVHMYVSVCLSVCMLQVRMLLVRSMDVIIRKMLRSGWRNLRSARLVTIPTGNGQFLGIICVMFDLHLSQLPISVFVCFLQALVSTLISSTVKPKVEWMLSWCVDLQVGRSNVRVWSWVSVYKRVDGIAFYGKLISILKATEHRLPCGIIWCYLPLDSGECALSKPSQYSIYLLWRMEGWVDHSVGYILRWCTFCRQSPIQVLTTW